MKQFSLVITLTILQIIAYSQIPDSSILKVCSPKSFKAKFKTTKGDLIIEVKREWSPLAVDRLYQLIQSNFYQNISIFRVQKGYVAQFGISDNSEANEFWGSHKIKDEPVILQNSKGTIHFAHGGPEDRTHQLYINLKDNSKLDTILYEGVKGFPGIAKIIDGIEIIDSLYSEYGFEPATKQDSIYKRGSSYLKEVYPKLDYIMEIKIFEE